MDSTTSFSRFYTFEGDPIGRGTYGDVYSATRRTDNLKVAAKVISRSKITTKVMHMITEEVRILKMLNHPHIVKVYDLYKDSRSYYICLEMISGGELFTRISKRVWYTEKEARDISKVILSAIRHCHFKNIVHCDLKPENFMLQTADDTSIKLIDFGFAVETCGDTITDFKGTPMYMAPEIWRKKSPYGKGVDMWSFGVIVYILMCGYPPFADDSTSRLMARICSGTFAFHPEYWSQVSAEAKDFVSQLLRVDVSQRMDVGRAVKHPWLNMSDEELARHDLGCGLSELKKFNARRKIKAVFKTVVAMKMWERIFKSSKSKSTSSSISSEDALTASAVSALSSEDSSSSSPSSSSSSSSLLPPPPPAASATASSSSSDSVATSDKTTTSSTSASASASASASTATPAAVTESEVVIDDPEFDALCRQFSTCYEAQDEEVGLVPVRMTPAMVRSASMLARSNSVAATATATATTAAAATAPAPAYDAVTVVASLPPSSLPTVESVHISAIEESVRRLQGVNNSLEHTVHHLLELINSHKATIESNKTLIQSLKSYM